MKNWNLQFWYKATLPNYKESKITSFYFYLLYLALDFCLEFELRSLGGWIHLSVISMQLHEHFGTEGKAESDGILQWFLPNSWLFLQ